MYRATTPTLTITVPEDVDLTSADSVYVSIADTELKEILRIDNPTVTEHQVDIDLTQEQTLKLPLGEARVQLNWLYEENSRTKRACSDYATVVIRKNIIDEVL